MTMNSWEMAFKHSPNASHFRPTTLCKPLTFICDGIQSKYIALATYHPLQKETMTPPEPRQRIVLSVDVCDHWFIGIIFGAIFGEYIC